MLNFIDEMKSHRTDAGVFNPWKDYSEHLDIHPEAPLIRAEHLTRYLEQRKTTAEYIFVAEALGYQGGRFSGIPMTSERIITGTHPDIGHQGVFRGKAGQRTSHPESDYPGFRNSWRKAGFSEPTASIVWKTLLENNIDSYKVIFWNVFPFHPYQEQKGLLSNRPPSADELRAGVEYLKCLLDYCPPNSKVVCIGKYAKEKLNQYGMKNVPIRHPSYGGAPEFKEGCRKLFSNKLV
ncbi:uracil-DNA glycosylase [Halobacillus kuroshimensis]|uniref:Uracil-DNA glycosylase n=1 Tax=Halobacillus kuroshimensis TaxID=302481 RepID=A0ABS3DWS6_9BACI|nr:uracil-DNA glycosylase [Halobacillus kuroshimensis]MBN8235784.1 uracil-DNA glycosylase [Halobacillus kuroshimensis]